jgi:hypothetical protein
MGFGGFGGFALFDEFVWVQDGALVGECAFVFLGPGFGVEEAILERGDVDGEFLRDGVVDGDFVAGKDFGVGPEFVEIVSLSVGCGDDAEFFGSAAERIADGGEDGFPDGLGVVVKRKFREDEICGVAANGAGLGGQSGDARAVGETDFGFGLAGDFGEVISDE